MTTRTKKGVHVLGAVAALACLVTAAVATPTYAAKSTRTTAPSTIVLNQTAPWLGENVTFTTDAQGLAGWEWSMVGVTCSQSGAPVYAALDTPSAAFLLGGNWSLWLERGGGADCTATIFAYGWKGNQESIRTLASTAFHAAGS